MAISGIHFLVGTRKLIIYYSKSELWPQNLPQTLQIVLKTFWITYRMPQKNKNAGTDILKH